VKRRGKVTFEQLEDGWWFAWRGHAEHCARTRFGAWRGVRRVERMRRAEW
jgi:hypothetical protein